MFIFHQIRNLYVLQAIFICENKPKYLELHKQFRISSNVNIYLKEVNSIITDCMILFKFERIILTLCLILRYLTERSSRPNQAITGISLVSRSPMNLYLVEFLEQTKEAFTFTDKNLFQEQV